MDAMPDAIGAIVALFIWLKVVSGVSYTLDMDENRMTIGLDSGQIASQATELALVGMRAGARVEYESVVYDPRAGSLTIAGLEIDAGKGAARIERLDLTGVSDDGPLDVRIAFEGLDIPVDALDLPTAAMLQVNLLGLERIEGDGALDLAYMLETSDARLDGEIELDGIGRIGAEIAVEALHFDLDREQVSGAVSRVALAFENNGALEALGPNFGIDPEAPEAGQELAKALGEQVIAILSEGKQPDLRVMDLGLKLEAALGQFFEDGDSIAVTMAPEPVIDLSDIEDLGREAQTPEGRARTLERLNLTLAAKPTLRAPVIVDIALGEDASTADRLRVANALRTGIGAPRDLERAIEILGPAAVAGDPGAASLAAEILLQRGDVDDEEEAYALSLVGMAGGAEGAASRVTRLAARLPADAVLAGERDAAALTAAGGSAPSDPLASLRAEANAGDATAMRKLALTLDAGRSVLRDTPTAYRWAVLGAAAGDAASARLRDRIAGRFAEGPKEDRGTWAEMIAEASAEASDIWLSGLGAKAAANAAQ